MELIFYFYMYILSGSFLIITVNFSSTGMIFGIIENIFYVESGLGRRK